MPGGPNTTAGARTSASPTTPPSPVGSGQAPPCGQQLAKPADITAHRIQHASRSASRSKVRWVSMRQPRTATGRISMIAPRPRICINRSAKIAPGYPTMLRMAPEVAWLRLGSCTDQVIRAAAPTPERDNKARPVSSRKRRANASRIDAGKWPTRGMTRSIAGMLMGALRLIQNFDQPVQRLGCCFTVLYQCQTNVAGAGIAAVGLLARQITSGHHAHAAVLVEFYRRCLIAAAGRHIEPDAETTGGAMITITIAEDLVGEIELDPVEPPVLLDMGLVAVGRDRDMLQWHWHLGCCDIAQFVKHAEKFPVAGRKADPHARQVRSLRQRLERNHIGEIRPRAFQHAAGCFPGVNLRIAFVAQNHEAETIGEPLQTCKIAARGHRALRICRRGDEDRDGSRQRGVVERIEVGEKSVGERGRQINRLAARRARAGRVSGIKRVRYQDRRSALAFAGITGGSERGEKQALAAAVEHQKLGLWIYPPRQVEPGGKPVRSRPPERLDALGDGIAAEIADVFGQNRADKGRYRVLRLA